MTCTILKRPELYAPRKFPLYSNQVQAGFPSPSDDHIEQFLDLHDHLIAHPAATFFVRVCGLSMRDAGILDGDILVVDRARSAYSGDIVIASLNGELTVKRLYKTSGVIELRAENPDFPTLSVGSESQLLIWGVVVGVVRKL